MRDDADGWVVPSLAQLVSVLPGSGPTRGKLLNELTQTIAFSAWNERQVPARLRRTLSFAELEGALEEGHPYHPCYKARTGFSVADHAAYGPEMGGAFQLVWLLVARKHLRCAIPGDEDAFWQAELGRKPGPNSVRSGRSAVFRQMRSAFCHCIPGNGANSARDSFLTGLPRAKSFASDRRGTDTRRRSRSDPC